MGKINGIVKDYKGNILQDAEVLFVDPSMNVLASGYSNEDGEYYLQLHERTTGMVVGTHSYGEKYLGYSVLNLFSQRDYRIDIELGNAEFLNYKRTVGADRNRFTCSFQVALLPLMKANSKSISPENFREGLKVFLGGTEIEEYTLKKEPRLVKEYGYSVDEYEITFVLPEGYRGQLLEMSYSTKEASGNLKVYL